MLLGKRLLIAGLPISSLVPHHAGLLPEPKGERKMKMAELSRITGISKNALSDVYYEKGKQIRYETLEKICEALGCTVGDLIEYQRDKTKPSS